MKAVSTFSFAPYLAGKSGGWRKEEDFLACAAASLGSVDRFHGPVTLHTDSLGADVFGVLGVPAEIRVTLDDLHEDVPLAMWCAAKFDTYSRQHEPFLHVDLDAILGEALPRAWLQAPLGVQSLELVAPGPWYDHKALAKTYGLPAELQGVALDQQCPPNVGVLAMNDLELNDEWCGVFGRFMQAHGAAMRAGGHVPHPCLLEQLVLGVLARRRGIEPVSLLPMWQSPISRRYTHLVGGLKTDHHALAKVPGRWDQKTKAAAELLRKAKR